MKKRIKLDPAKQRLHDLRVETVKVFKPGSRVRVVRREIESPPDNRGNIGSSFLEKLRLWKQPDGKGPRIGTRWREFRDDPDLGEYYESLKGPMLLLHDKATVMAVLPHADIDIVESVPWILLLSDAGELGWCYAIDALSLLSYYE